MNHVVMMQMEILLKFEEMCQDITKEFSPLFSKVKYHLVADKSHCLHIFFIDHIRL
jgi:hypothetical protein